MLKSLTHVPVEEEEWKSPVEPTLASAHRGCKLSSRTPEFGSRATVMLSAAQSPGSTLVMMPKLASISL